MLWICDYCSTGNNNKDKYCIVCEHKRPKVRREKEPKEVTTKEKTNISYIKYLQYPVYVSLLIVVVYLIITLFITKSISFDIDNSLTLIKDELKHNIKQMANIEFIWASLKLNISLFGEMIKSVWEIIIMNAKEILS